MSKQATTPPPGDKPKPSNAPPPPPAWRHWLWLIALVAIFVLWFILPTVHRSPQTSLTYSQFLTDVNAGKVKSVDRRTNAGGTSTGTLKGGTNYTVVVPSQAGQPFLDEMSADGVEQSASASSPGFGSELLGWLVILLPLLVFGWLWFRLSRGAAGQLQGVLGAGQIASQGL